MITAQQVADWLKLQAVDNILTTCTDAVNAYVSGLPDIDLTDDGEWADSTVSGAVMLAARYYRRRNTPSGVAEFSDGSVYVPRYDADVARLLHLDQYEPPKVG